MRNTIIVTVLLFVAVIAASIYYFRAINNEHHDIVKPLKYLPENTMLITSVKNDEITDNIFKDFELFDAILGFKDMEVLRSFKNQLLRNETLKAYLTDTEIYISFHPTSANEINALFTIPTSNDIAESDFDGIMQSLSKNYKITTSDTLGQRITSFSFGNPDTTLHSTYYQNTLFASYSKPLLISIFDKATKHLPENQIDYFLKFNSRNTPLSVYFPNQQYESILKHFQQRDKGLFADQFKGLKGQSAWNINFKQDALILTGESELENTAGNYIALFRHQQKTSQQLYNYFPANTSVYMEYSFDDRAQFTKDLDALLTFRKEKEKINNSLQNVSDSTSILTQLSSILGNNFALIEQTNQTNLGFITLNDTAAWEDAPSALLENVGDSIYRFKNSHILYSLYGDPFKEMSRPYITRVQNVLVVSNSSTILRQYQADWRRKNLLTGTLGFKNFEKLQGNDANVTLFVHNKNAYSKILNSLPSEYRKNYRDKEKHGFQDFYSWSVQLAGNNGSLGSQIYAIYKSKTALGVTPEWTYGLENKAITQPYVFEHSDTSQFILLQELDHTMHAIHPTGVKMWSTVFAGRVVGNIQQLKDRSIVLVTDRNRLYRFDTNGKSLPGFSTSIPAEPVATPTQAIIHGEEAFLIPTAHQVYAYSFDGKQIDSWEKNSVNGKISTKIAVTEAGEFVFGTDQGDIIWLNQNGSQVNRLTLDASSDILAIQTSSNNSLFAIDKKGQVNHIKDRKLDVRWPSKEYEGKLYTDFTASSGNNHSFYMVNKNNFSLYTVQGSLNLQYEYNFTKDITDRPQILNSANPPLLGVSSKTTNLVYLFNSTGGMIEGFPVEGQPLFYYGKINYNSATYLLCMRRDHKLYAFRHQK